MQKVLSMTSKADILSNKNYSSPTLPEADDTDHEIQLDESYSDDDFNIYFDKASLLNYITFLEDDNLFKIHLVQEDE